MTTFRRKLIELCLIGLFVMLCLWLGDADVWMVRVTATIFLIALMANIISEYRKAK